MTCDATPARIPVKVFIKRNIVSPMRIVVEHRTIAKHGPLAVGVAQENMCYPPRQLLGHFPQRHHVPPAGGAFHLKAAAVVKMVFPKRLNDKEINWHPDRPAP